MPDEENSPDNSGQKRLPAARKTKKQLPRSTFFQRVRETPVEPVVDANGDEVVQSSGWVDEALAGCQLELEERAARRERVHSHPMIATEDEIRFLAELHDRREKGDRRIDAGTLNILHAIAVKLGIRQHIA